MKKQLSNLIIFLANHFKRHWLKWIAAILIAGAAISSCEIPTPWGYIKKGGIKIPFMDGGEK